MGKCLIVPGGTSAELIGTALPKHVIEGQTFYNTNEEELLTGEIPVQGDVTITPTESTQNAYVTGKYMEGDVKVGAISKTYVGSGVTRQAAKTVSPTESEQTVVANGVYTTGAVKVGAISSTYVGSGVTKRTSSNLSVSSAGLITAPAGYYSSAATKQLTTTAAKTITPSTASQTAVNAGVYTTGAIKVAAIPSTYVNISSGATVFNNGSFSYGYGWGAEIGFYAGNTFYTKTGSTSTASTSCTANSYKVNMLNMSMNLTSINKIIVTWTCSSAYWDTETSSGNTLPAYMLLILISISDSSSRTYSQVDMSRSSAAKVGAGGSVTFTADVSSYSGMYFIGFKSRTLGSYDDHPDLRGTIKTIKVSS